MARGVIYITTTSVTGLIKIGKTRTDQFENRMTILEQNGYWNVNGLHRFYAVEVNDYDEKEKLIHTVFSKSQVSTSELFALDKELVKEMLESFGGKQIYPKPVKTQNTQPKKEKAQRLTFGMLNIPSGAVLEFSKDRSLTCKVIDAVNKVNYRGTEYTLSALAMKLLKISSAQGGAYFMYNGELLTDRRKRMGL